MIDHEREQAMEQKAFTTGPSDADRLDWLDQQTNFSLLHSWWENPPCVTLSAIEGILINPRGATVREAIDAAIAEQRRTDA